MADQVRILFLMATMIDAIKFLKNKSFSVFTLFHFVLLFQLIYIALHLLKTEFENQFADVI